MRLFLGLIFRFERQHVRWAAAAAGPSLRHPHRQHLHPLHHLHRPGPHLHGREGRVPVRDSLPGRGWLAESALPENQPLQKLLVVPRPLRASVLVLWRWWERKKRFQTCSGCNLNIACQRLCVCLFNRSHCTDCCRQLPQHTVHTVWERCPAGLSFH